MTWSERRTVVDARRIAPVITTLPVGDLPVLRRPAAVAVPAAREVLAWPAPSAPVRQRAKRVVLVASVTVSATAVLGVSGYLLGRAHAGAALMAMAVGAVVLAFIGAAARRAGGRSGKHCPGCPE